MRKLSQFLLRLYRAEAFSPEAFIRRALTITILFTISECLGLREYTTFLSGTSANLALNWQVAAVLGCIHLLLYVGFILLVPVWVIAAGLMWAWKRCAFTAKV